MPAHKKILVIVGPTASGKTRLAVELAKEHNGEVVSADSMQIYRGMDIGTAKPTAEEMGGVPHHMIDVADPWEDFSVARYVDMAARCEGGGKFFRVFYQPGGIFLTVSAAQQHWTVGGKTFTIW